MPLDLGRRVREPAAPALDLPTAFRPVALREVGDAFAHARSIAADAGAGTLVHVGRFDLAELAVVLEPEEPLRTARRALYAGMVALGNALATHAPPEKPITFDWPDAVRIDGGLVGGGQLAWPAGTDEATVPAWIVFGAMIRTVGGHEPGLHSPTTALDAEGFVDLGRLTESFARHLMATIDGWQQDGFAAVARSYLARLVPEKGVDRALDEDGDLLRRLGKSEIERRALAPALMQPSWLDPASSGPRLTSAP